MIGYHREPTLEEILSDSVTRAVMEADGVDRQELEAMLRQAGRNLPPLRGGERLVPQSMSSGRTAEQKSRASETEQPRLRAVEYRAATGGIDRGIYHRR
jgi:hypothetical protein